MTTAILTDARYIAHTYPGHPESAERLIAINKALDNSGLRGDLLELAARPASEDELRAVHTQEHIDTIQHMGQYGGGHLDPDTYMNEASWEAALWSAGGAMRMVEAVVKGEADNGFALLRPPGHHATPTRAMGFCLLNNIALAARYALQNLGMQRVAIVDFDVHHGNGTQDVFYRERQVLFCSSHASPYYPGTGMLHEMGTDQGAGSTLNVPLPFKVGDKGYEQIFSEVIIPAVRRWRPDLLLVSAGYDAHWLDPIGPMVLSTAGYTRLTQMLYDLAAEACEGRMAMILEGGYSLEALSAGVTAGLHVLLGRDPGPDPFGPMTPPEPDISHIIGQLHRNHPLFQTKDA